MEMFDLKGALILRILLAIPLVFLTFKVLVFFIRNLKRNDEKSVDFEEMVRRKTEYLKFSGEHQNTIVRDLNISNTEKVYREFFSLPQNDNSDKKSFMQVFASLQWGEGQFHFDLINYFKKSYNFDLDLIRITKCLKDLIKNDILISPKWRNLPSYFELEQIMTMKIIQDIFVEEAKNWVGVNLKVFFQKEDLDLNHICRAIIYYFAPNSKNLIFSNILKNIPLDYNLAASFKLLDLEARMNQKLLEQNNHIIFIKEISTLSLLFGSLKKIEPLRSKFDLTGAKRIFNLETGASLEDIKKRYKSLAKINHPDSLSSFGLPPEILQIVNINFSQIKNAYDLLIAQELAK
jgi:hypothetical protein